jgi:hypothetical protein
MYSAWIIVFVQLVVILFAVSLSVAAFAQIRRQGRQITELRRDRNEWRAVVFRVRELWVATSGENTPVVAFEDFASAMETIVREVQP